MIWNLPASITFPGYTDEKYEWYSYYSPKLREAKAQFAKFNDLIGDAVVAFDKKHPDVTVYFLILTLLSKKPRKNSKIPPPLGSDRTFIRKLVNGCGGTIGIS